MVQGKKGFERVVWAFTRVLSEPINWLFYNFQSKPTDDPSNLANSELRTCTLSINKIPGVVLPVVDSTDAFSDRDYQEELLEWLGLMLIESPRVQEGDKVEKYLCRYQLPELFNAEGPNSREAEDVVHVQLLGCILSRTVTELFLNLKENQKNGWFAVNGKAFEGGSYSILCPKERNILVWEL